MCGRPQRADALTALFHAQGVSASGTLASPGASGGLQPQASAGQPPGAAQSYANTAARQDKQDEASLLLWKQ